MAGELHVMAFRCLRTVCGTCHVREGPRGTIRALVVAAAICELAGRARLETGVLQSQEAISRGSTVGKIGFLLGLVRLETGA